MGTGGRPGCGVCAAADVHYLSTGGARAAAVLAADAAFAHVLAERTAVVARVPACRPGEFYLRELPRAGQRYLPVRLALRGWPASQGDLWRRCSRAGCDRGHEASGRDWPAGATSRLWAPDPA
ncbi:MAG: hypothetical protein ACLQB1_43005 [Streptosporangiaceae bacterium]